MADGLRLQDVKVAWVLPVTGNQGYIKDMLKSFSQRCGTFRLFTVDVKGDENILGFEIDCHRVCKFIGFHQKEREAKRGAEVYGTGVILLTPSVVPALLRYHPDLMIIDEFNLWSLYVVLTRNLLPKARVLLVVEARPRFPQSQWLSFSRHVLRSFIAKRVDMLLTNSADGKGYLTLDLQAPDSQIVVSPYLVSDMAYVSGLSRSELQKHRSSRSSVPLVRFLYVGRLVQPKGLQYALESLAALLPEYTGRFVFEMVGDGPFRARLERQAQDLGLSRHVRFRGRQPYSALWEWYLKADVFLFPTLADYRALAPFEALSMGLPIVASVHDGGIRETIEAGRNGFYFDPRDTVALAKILTFFLDSPELIPSYAKRSLEMAEAYTLERGTESLVKACQRALTC